MDLYKIISELVQERERLTHIIESLEGMAPSGGKSQGATAQFNPGGKRRGRKSMDGAARKEVSERMKLYWANRRAQKYKSADEELAGRSVSA